MLHTQHFETPTRTHTNCKITGRQTPLLAQPACYESPDSIFSSVRIGATELDENVMDDKLIMKKTEEIVHGHGLDLVQSLQVHFQKSTDKIKDHFISMLQSEKVRQDGLNNDLAQQLEVCTTRLISVTTDKQNLLRTKASRLMKFSQHVQKSKSRELKRKLFTCWKVQINDSKKKEQYVRFFQRMREKSKLQKIFAVWSRITLSQKMQTVNSFWQIQLENNAEMLINKYENELLRLRKLMDDQKSALQASKRSKEELESKMKQLFLRGVSAMSLEAVGIFQKEHNVSKID